MNQKIIYHDNGLFIKSTWYDLEYIRKLYIQDNKSQAEMCKLLSVSRGSFIEIVNHFQLFKDADVIKKNRQKAIINKYGVNSVMLVPEIREKAIQNVKQKYGGQSALVDPIVRERAKNTMLIKYGVEYPSLSPEIVEKRRKNYFDKYHIDTHFQKNIMHFDIWRDDIKFNEFLNNFAEKPTYIELAEYFNVDRTAVNAKVLKLGLESLINVRPGYSQYENEIIQTLIQICSIREDQIIRNARGLLGDSDLEIDIYIPEHHFGIEFNGDYWHCDIFHQDHCGRTVYHQNKSLMSEHNGIFLFHVFEYEWNNEILREKIIDRWLQILHTDCDMTKISARKCAVNIINKDQKKQFLEDNHLQGNDHSTYDLGLIYDGEIVACMTFVHPKSNKYTWELTRFCVKRHYCIRGGASKLFSFFLQNINKNDTIVSYNDITKTTGNLYKILGFSCISINQPNYIWINFQTKDIRTRYQEQAAGEVKRMHSLGYHRLCDCGTKTWLYTKE